MTTTNNITTFFATAHCTESRTSKVVKMGLQAAYERFLQRPIPANFAENATLQYVTTLKSFKGGSKIVEHIGEQQQNVVKKKAEKIISVVEGSTAVVVIAETTLEFVSAGGAYLPGLDSFIIDRQATLPIVRPSSTF